MNNVNCGFPRNALEGDNCYMHGTPDPSTYAKGWVSRLGAKFIPLDNAILHKL